MLFRSISFSVYPGLSPGGIGGLVGAQGAFSTALYGTLNSDAASLWWQTGRASSHQIQPVDGGRTYTVSAHYSPTYGRWDSSGGGDCGHDGAADTPTMSVYVPWYYQLHPRIDINDDTPTIVQQGTDAQIDPKVTLNSKDDRGDGVDRWNTCADNFSWDLTVTAQRPDTPTVKEPLDGYHRSGSKGAWEVCPSADAQTITSGPSVDTSVFPAGTTLCGHLEVWDETEGGGRASADKCTVVVKQPKVQFWNSDVNVGRHFQQPDNDPTCGQPGTSPGSAGITTSGPPTSRADRNLYGSWVEYGAFASGSVDNFGSAAENKTGSFDFSPTGQRLTFGNDDRLGQYSYANWCIPGYDKLIEPQRGQDTDTPVQAGSTIDLGRLEGNSYYRATRGGTITLTDLGGIPAGRQDITLDAPSANVVIDGGTIKPGVRLVIHARGSITIRGNLSYADSGYASINQIPRLVLVAGSTVNGDPDASGLGLQPNIVVDEDVTRVDAWLIAHGALYTCDTDPSSFNYHNKHCGKRLTINGPVAAGAIHLRRTFGADVTNQDDYEHNGPAEVFNLNPTSLLGSYSAAQKGNFTDVYQRQAPPRY